MDADNEILRIAGEIIAWAGSDEQGLRSIIDDRCADGFACDTGSLAPEQELEEARIQAIEMLEEDFDVAAQRDERRAEQIMYRELHSDVI